MPEVLLEHADWHSESRQFPHCKAVIRLAKRNSRSGSGALIRKVESDRSRPLTG